jgi:predicted nuclease of restriction endonuclease-like (RecB) superfamily
MKRNPDAIPTDYPGWLETLKGQIAVARSRAALAVNAELIHLYHRIGREILERQTHHGWGTKVITRIADDLKAAFPDMKGFSTRNVKYMRYFAEHCPDAQFGQQPAAQLPWFHIVTLLTKAEPTQREWYATQCVAGGWSRLSLRDLPVPLAENLPSIEAIEAEFAGDVLDDAEAES